MMKFSWLNVSLKTFIRLFSQLNSFHTKFDLTRAHLLGHLFLKSELSIFDLLTLNQFPHRPTSVFVQIWLPYLGGIAWVI